MRAAAFLDPRLRGGDKKGIHSPLILLETLRPLGVYAQLFRAYTGRLAGLT